MNHLKRALLLFLLAAGLACSAAPRPQPSDWTSDYRGAGSVPTHIANEARGTVTVRVVDRAGQILAQVTIPPRSRESIYLPPGRVIPNLQYRRGGEQVTDIGEEWHVPLSTIGFDIRVFPPADPE